MQPKKLWAKNDKLLFTRQTMHQLQRTVIARSEATWQSPGTNSKNRCTKGEVRAKIAPSISRCAFRYIIPGDCHGPKGPRNDTVTVTQVRSRYCAKQQFILQTGDLLCVLY